MVGSAMAAGFLSTPAFSEVACFFSPPACSTPPPALFSAAAGGLAGAVNSAAHAGSDALAGGGCSEDGDAKRSTEAQTHESAVPSSFDIDIDAAFADGRLLGRAASQCSFPPGDERAEDGQDPGFEADIRFGFHASGDVDWTTEAQEGNEKALSRRRAGGL